MFQFKVQTAAKTNSSTSVCSESSTESSNSCIDNSANLYSIGDRIKCDDHLGTVRYIGAVDPHPGSWLGVEWDDPSRGRHNGSVNGVEYFKCSIPNAASFVRPNKVKKCKTIREAIRERYGYDPHLIDSIEDIAGGLERRRIEYDQLKIVDVSSRQVSDLEKPGILEDLTPNIEFLNLADNLVSDWEAIGQVCIGLKHLIRLDVSENPLKPVPELPSDTLTTVFQNVEHVIMGKVNYDWDAVLKASMLFLKLKNFHIQYNKISSITSPTTTLMHVTSLDLGGNQLTSWDDVIKLDVLHELEYLSLCGNKISQIRFPSSEESGKMTTIFRNLVRLNVSENSISDWQSVNELNKLENLRELRIDTNPFLYTDTNTNNRQFIIARLGRLQKLEGVDITRQERRDCELDYVKRYSALLNSSVNKAEFALAHPRYAELVEIFGYSDVGESNSQFKSMKSSLISVNLIPEGNSKPPVSKKLLQSMPVQKLKMMLQRMFGVPGAQIQIRVVSSKNPDISFILDNDFFLLTQYSIEDGDNLYLKW